MSPLTSPAPNLVALSDPTWFDWWADILIPSLLGIATVIVAVVALLTSHRATALAHAVEVEREKSEIARAEEQRRLRVQEMAIEESRTLQWWVVEVAGARRRLRRVGQYDTGRTESEQARIDAQVALTQSIVPGAADLLEITNFDMENRWTFIGDAETDEQKQMRARIAGARAARTSARIRRWALDPEGQAPEIAGELLIVDDDPRGYLMFGEEPLSDD